MTRSTITVAPRLLDEAGQGPSDIGRPLVPSDPWTNEWVPPSGDELADKHARAKQRERDLARYGHRSFGEVSAGTDESPEAAVGPDAEPATAPAPTTPKKAARASRRSADAHSPILATPPRRSIARRLLSGAAAIATAYWYHLLATIVIAIAIPLASGWDASTVVTGSMEPAISPGDVVAFDRYEGGPLAIGTIVQFHDPSHPGETVTHRIVGVNPDGTYTTKGDANVSADSTPVPPDSIIGVARIVAPNAGLPQVWLHRHEHLTLALWAVITVAAIAVMSVHSSTERRRHRQERARPRRSRRLTRSAIAFGLAAAVAGVGTAAWSQGRFADAAAPAPSTFESAASFVTFSHDGSLGTVTCGVTQSVLTLGTAVPTGRTIVVRFALRDLQGGSGYSATDSRGNTYTVDAVSADGSRTEAAILSAHVTTALIAGDTITVSHPRGRATVVTADVFSGIAATNRVVATGIGSGNDVTPMVGLELTQAPALAVGHIVVRDAVTVTDPVSGWTPMASGTVSCNRVVTHRAAFDQRNQTGTVTYDPTFDSRNRWSGVVVAYGSG